jgi:hypothetical protein
VGGRNRASISARNLWVLVVGVLLTVVAGSVQVGAAATAGPTVIRVLSNRADLVSGGEALVEVVLPAGVDPGSARIAAAGRDVTASFAANRLPGLLRGIPAANRTGLDPTSNALVGVVSGLQIGNSALTATLADGSGATITINNHPAGGPVFAGTQVQPWVCNTQNPPPPPISAGQPTHLGPSTDAQCSTPAVFEYFFHTSDPALCQNAPPCFAPYDRANPPSGVPTTTTDQGVTVPYIVRVEEGVEDRGIYALAVLDDPGKPWTPWDPQPAWNHKLVTTFGASTSMHHSQGGPSAVLDQPVTASPGNAGGVNWWSPDSALSRGFAVGNSGLNVKGENGNEVVSAEALMMLKEHIVNRYGLIRYTIGNGCSGGGLAQYLIAAMYPGLLDGIQPNCSYTDTWTTAPDVVDCHLIDQYITSAAPPGATPVTAAQQAFVDGHFDSSDCVTWDATFAGAVDPKVAKNCDLPAADVYNPTTNPRGVRCSLQDYDVATWGPRPPSVWGPVEKSNGAGFGKFPMDNTGVQYGLVALNAGEITVDQFLDLNARIGSMDNDANIVAGRRQADPGTTVTAYRAGQVSDARQLATVPIIDLRGWSESGEIHTSFYSYKLRARLDRENGGHGNQLIWTFKAAAPLLGIIAPPAVALQSFLAIDSWLARIEADGASGSLAAKVLRDRPGTAVDGCWAQGDIPASGPMITDSSTCAALYPHFANTRVAAGAPVTDDVIKCRLKHPAASDYQVQVSAGQLQQIDQVFPTGVCDWSKPGVDQQPSIPWMTYAGGPGGTPLGDAPGSNPFAASVLNTPNTAAAGPLGGEVVVGLGLLLLVLITTAWGRPAKR